MKYTWMFFTVLLAVVGNHLYGQSTVKIQYDSLHRVTAKRYYTNKLLTRIVTFYPNGKKETEYSYQANGKKFGPQTEYYETGSKKREFFVLGAETIAAKYLFPDKSDDYTVDVLSGKETNYNRNGTRSSEGYVVNALRAGYWVFYDSTGNFDHDQFYECLTKVKY